MKDSLKPLGEAGRPPFIPAIEALTEQAELALAANNEAARSALADCTRALKGVIARASVPDGFERVEIKQNRGTVLEFTGKLLCDTVFDTRRGDLRIELELYLTQGGAFVAVSHSNPIGREGREFSDAIVIPREEDEMAMRIAAMDFWTWEDRARSMVVKSLGWGLREEVA